MRKNLVFGILLFISVFILVLTWLFCTKTIPVPDRMNIDAPWSAPETSLLDRQKEFAHVIEEPMLRLPEVVQEINERNKSITSFTCEKARYVVWQKGFRYRLSGNMHYEKPKRFRMQIDSIFGREVDIGSNDELFWYWSRRDNDPGLHYANHADIGKTNLKTPFNPDFLRATLGFEIFSNKNVKIAERDNDILLVYSSKSPSGDPLAVSIFVNKEKKRVDGYTVRTLAGTLVATCEIQEYDGVKPSKILYNWEEEKGTMLILLPGSKLNVRAVPETWRMPDYSPRSNMAEH